MRIKNTGRYALAFTINKNGKEVSIEFDKRRLYLDTGNIATTGITEVSDEDFELLTFDAVLEPSTPNAYIRNTAEELQPFIENKQKNCNLINEKIRKINDIMK